MACYWPIPALQNGASGPVRLWPPKGTANLELPCGKCLGCRTAKALQWSARCQHEASTWPVNSFVTLTYDDEHLPKEAHLEPRSLQLFFKRLRKHAHSTGSSIDRDRSGTIRYFACGEYGELSGRPHYHAILFNCGFSDRKRVGKDLYESEQLAELWPYGQNRIGEMTAAAATYVAQYNLKKQGQGDHDADGVWRPAPFLRMSLKPAIGNAWLEKYQNDLRHGYLVTDGGNKQGIPRHYTNKIKNINVMLHEEMEYHKAQQRRVSAGGDRNHPERREDGDKIHQQKARLSQRIRV